MARVASTWLLGLLLLGLGRPALAAQARTKPSTEPPAAEDPSAGRAAKEKAAKKACATGDYQQGVDLLADLFVDTNDAAYVYNQGRCYQQNSRWEQAISRFREYLRKAKNLSESERSETQRQIDECQEALAEAAPRVPPLAAPSPASPPTGEQTLPVTELHGRPPPGSAGKGLRLAGIIVASVGVAAVATGVGLALKANGLSTSEYSQSRESERSSLRRWGLASYGVGAAAIATGTVLYLVGRARASSSRAVLLPVVAPDRASLSLQGRF